jgi:predicted DNA binding CopG/RHH family protein
MRKTIPALKTDEDAEQFVETADLSDYDLSGFMPAQFEFQAKDRQINMRLPQPLLDAVKAAAKRGGMPYQRFIRQALERAVTGGMGEEVGRISET